MNHKKAIVIGAGFSGLSAACYLSKLGFDVHVFEKNNDFGGRARKLEMNGFTFDLGPSWYWMPEVFENFFKDFDTNVAAHYHLERLDPSYRVYFSKQEIMDLPAAMDAILQLVESKQPGAAKGLQKFLKDAEFKYRNSMEHFIHKPCLSVLEFMDMKILKAAFKMDLFSSISAEIKKHFSHPHLIQLLEFPVLFLGAKPVDTPALFSMMNYADMALGTWYPKGGMYEIINAFVIVAKKQQVHLLGNENVTEISIQNGKATGIVSNGKFHAADVVLSTADYHHTEQNLLPEAYRNYSTDYWKSRKMAPSCLMFYLGIDKKLKGLLHHNLFFDTNFDLHGSEIYDHPQWPSQPLFYVTCASQSDDSVAPIGMENLVLLMPIANALEDTEEIREKYFNLLMMRLEKLTGQEILQHVIFKKSYCITNFKSDYNSFGGNAYGLANTLLQTAFLKPSIRNKKVRNLFYAGQLSVPGPGVPPSIISGQIVANEIAKHFSK